MSIYFVSTTKKPWKWLCLFLLFFPHAQKRTSIFVLFFLHAQKKNVIGKQWGLNLLLYIFASYDIEICIYSNQKLIHAIAYNLVEELK